MRRLAALAVTAAAVTGCQTVPPASMAGTVDTHEAMVRWINPAALALWDVTNAAMSDTGGLDPALMDEAAWSKLLGAAQVLEEHSRHMAQAQTLYVGAHNDAIEGFATRAEIQAMIDADPAGFRRSSQEMAEQAAQLVAAARAKDPRQAGALSENLSERCQDCHSRYWEKPA